MPNSRVVIVKLTKAARKSGGDKYESQSGIVIYIPQFISRPNGTNLPPLQFIKVTFEVTDQVGFDIRFF